ncbi:protein LTO1 homolog [Papilio machaon]|uniref:protein LTO1 homolog n=1 Tax=Papilio machaon TaxID=76193 RepID=UPI001E664798|nr:protein LTO1 homolog [Papilio machaon]
MADDIDFNDVVEDIFLSENTLCQDSYKEGFRVGSEEGNSEGYHLGYHRGAEIGRELGFYYGIVTNYLEQNKSDSKQEDRLSDKTIKQLEKVKGLIDTFPHNNSEHHDILTLLETIRAQYKKVCAMLKVSSNNPYVGDISF